MSRVLRTIAGLVLGIGLAATFGQARAEEPQAANPVKLQFKGASPARAKGQLLLTAVLTAPDGKALSERRVEFYQSVSVFGPGEAYLGTMTTDATGAAVLAYQPAQLGRHEIRVGFSGGGGYARAVAAGTIEVREVMPLYKSEPPPYGLVGQWLPYVLGALVLATCMVIAGTLLATGRNIWAAGQRALYPAPAHTSQITRNMRWRVRK